ncbi:MAG: hypothetical protein AMXMBFR4_16970 [Candidatus Hydrogenedentota bacterium]
MAAQEISVLHFDRVMNYAVRVAERYSRSLSLVCIASGNGPVSYRKCLEGRTRESDEIQVFRDSAAILMGETDRAGALKAVDRLRRTCGRDVDIRFSVASYPEDGEAAAAIFTKASRRLDHARSGGPGTVVSEG